MTRRPVAGIVAMFAVVFTLLAGVSPAWAHASLESSSPGAFAVLEASPADVRLRFSEVPQAGFTSVRLVDAENRDRAVGSVVADPNDARTLVATVDPLPDGLYVVVWSVVSADGHRVAGSFAFSVGVSGTSAARDLLARVAAGHSSDVALDRLATGVRAFGFIALALLLGGGWVRHGTGGGRHAPTRLDHLVWIGWAWSLIAAVALLMVQSAQVTGGGVADIVDVQRWGELLDARQGQALMARIAVLGVAAWLVARGPHGGQRRSWHPTAAMVGLALALTHTVAGHGATAGVAWLAVIVGALHLAAVSGWLGALAALVVGAKRWDGGSSEALAVIAPLARSAAPVAVVTGIVSTLLIGPPMADLVDTRWGRILIVKIVLVTVLVALGVAIGRGAARSSMRWKPRLLMTEVIVGVVTLGTAAALVSTPPTVSVVIEPVTTTLVQGGVLAEVTITPASLGENELHLVMSPPGGSLQPIGQVTARLNVLDRDVPPFAVELAVAGVNHWTAPLQFPYGGRWQLEIVAEVRPLELVQYRTDFNINR